jgi:hypothetical protein
MGENPKGDFTFIEARGPVNVKQSFFSFWKILTKTQFQERPAINILWFRPARQSAIVGYA